MRLCDGTFVVLPFCLVRVRSALIFPMCNVIVNLREGAYLGPTTALLQCVLRNSNLFSLSFFNPGYYL